MFVLLATVQRYFSSVTETVITFNKYKLSKYQIICKRKGLIYLHIINIFIKEDLIVLVFKSYSHKILNLSNYYKTRQKIHIISIDYILNPKKLDGT